MVTFKHCVFSRIAPNFSIWLYIRTWMHMLPPFVTVTLEKYLSNVFVSTFLLASILVKSALVIQIFYALVNCSLKQCIGSLPTQEEFIICSITRIIRVQEIECARFIRTVCMRRIQWSCEGLTSVHNKYTGYTLKHLLLRHLYNLLLPVLPCYALEPRAATAARIIISLTLYCVVLYILLV